MDVREPSAKYLARPAYKHTEVGVIPEDWEVRCIKEFAEVKGGKRLPLGWLVTGEVTPHPYLRVTDMRPGGVDLRDIKYVPEEAFPPIRNYRIFVEDIFISVAGSLGIVGKIPQELDGANLTENADRITAIQCSRDYLLYWLLSDKIQGTIEAERTVGAQPKLALNRIEDFAIALPPTYAEQQAIAEALSDAEALIESLEQLLVKKRQIKQGAMQELLRPKPSDEIRLLREVSSLKGRIGWQGLKQAEFSSNEDEPFLITGMNFKDGAIAWDQVYHISEARYEMAPEIQLAAGDLLMTKDGTIGKVLYIDTIPFPGKASLNSHLLLFRPIRGSYNPKYLYYQLSTERFKSFVELSKSGTTFFGLSQTAVGAYPVLLPPIEEQTAIATVLSDMDAELATLEAKLAKARNLKQGMMQELLTGRIRLV
ncbi:MAG: restriction endonuclease subunit S [Rhodocyclales bacterium]|nr:restriction endonuclease subunit S [Rhodocyclales bacterium]